MTDKVIKYIEHVQAAKEEINTFVAHGVVNPMFEDIILGGLNLLKIVYDKYIWASSHQNCDYPGAHGGDRWCPTYLFWKDARNFLIDAGFKELV